MKTSFIVSALAIAFQAVSASPAVVPRQAKSFTINSVTYGGTGCPQGSFKPVIQGNKVLLDGHFTSTIKQGASVIERRRNCQLGLDITFHSGWKRARVLTTYKGELNLNAEAKGTLSQTYYIAGQTDQGKSDRSFTGPINTGYFLISNLDIPAARQTCAGSSELLNINSAAVLEGDLSKGANGYVYVDFSGSELNVNVDWLDC